MQRLGIPLQQHKVQEIIKADQTLKKIKSKLKNGSKKQKKRRQEIDKYNKKYSKYQKHKVVKREVKQLKLQSFCQGDSQIFRKFTIIKDKKGMFSFVGNRES